ncbi:antibiotic biosynthesis monooxygenase [Frankia sp. CNm7]|uniref:Antibiotic biosynthesis monooxygenase n=1 Tax=Frankia nepalensis TaxID=1836974 RepID=A0A937UNW8_9ACTN|nr:putative quinol monooxygenase [Frankia nepalensis]MBL7500903.1 antibiotic biosynthesis monooxygenase [Frankia nepalensis]MBL7510332.1 antibiotic biosynthesis monooxygenase [Frankia nepalensis]MBL7519136.1 antibiotic biosynthesis monooxygenase [Frankia nepalensis]MBL7626670.1 antibiotic biosynthesis monooxygenase [Frankia nepalensis]
MPVIVATVAPKPEHVDEVRRVLLGVIPEVHQEPGCKLYSLHEGGGKFFFIEEWADDAALAAHSGAPALAAMVKDLDGLLEGGFEVHVLTPLPAGSPDQGQLRP